MMQGEGQWPRVVVVGCGFGGLAAARALRGKPVRVTVVDRTNHHLFQPLLYQVATAGLTAPAVAAPIRTIFAHQPNVTVLCAQVRGIDRERGSVQLDPGEALPYDYLVLATGASNSYFGNDHWEPHAPSLKTLADAYEIRRRVLFAFEHAEREADPGLRAAWLTFVVIGAGATGVELAGSFAEIARHALRGEFRRIDPHNARVVLVEGSDQVLPTFPSSLCARARAQLERLGVTVWVGRRVTGIDATGVDLGDDRLAARTVVWAAGVAASPVGALLGTALDRAGRVPVGADLALAEDPRVFVVGDLATVPGHEPPVPGTAPAAKQMGAQASRNILARIGGREPQPFRYHDVGMLATIGRNAAVAVFGRVRLSGYPAWLIWLIAHIWFLIGFRNRIVVMIDWAWAYWTLERNARIVTSAIDADTPSR